MSNFRGAVQTVELYNNQVKELKTLNQQSEQDKRDNYNNYIKGMSE